MSRLGSIRDLFFYAFIRKQVFAAVKVQCLDDDLNQSTIVQTQCIFVTISELVLNTIDNFNFNVVAAYLY